jgi:hypothetical protein
VTKKKLLPQELLDIRSNSIVSWCSHPIPTSTGTLAFELQVATQVRSLVPRSLSCIHGWMPERQSLSTVHPSFSIYTCCRSSVLSRNPCALPYCHPWPSHVRFCLARDTGPATPKCGHDSESLLLYHAVPQKQKHRCLPAPCPRPVAACTVLCYNSVRCLQRRHPGAGRRTATCLAPVL